MSTGTWMDTVSTSYHECLYLALLNKDNCTSLVWLSLLFFRLPWECCSMVFVAGLNICVQLNAVTAKMFIRRVNSMIFKCK